MLRVPIFGGEMRRIVLVTLSMKFSRKLRVSETIAYHKIANLTRPILSSPPWIKFKIEYHTTIKMVYRWNMMEWLPNYPSWAAWKTAVDEALTTIWISHPSVQICIPKISNRKKGRDFRRGIPPIPTCQLQSISTDINYISICGWVIPL